MNGRRIAVLMLAICLGVIVVSGAVAADPGTHQVNVTDGNGDVNASYQYDASTGNVTATYDGGVPEEISLGNPNESALAIQWATDNSTATHSTIRIGPGTYNGTVNVTTNNRTISAVNGPTGTNLTGHPASGQNGININASNVLVENVTVRSAQDSGIVILSDSENVSLRGVSVIDSANYGVRLVPPTTDGFHSITDSTFSENGYWAISAERVHENEILNNTVTDSLFGIELYSSFRNSVEGNWIHHNSGGSFTGISLTGGSTDNNISRNVIQHNSGIGIQVGSSTDTVRSTTLQENRIENVSETGVHVAGNGTTLDGTVIYGSGGEGIHLEGFVDQTIRNVTVRNSTGRGIQVNGTANVEIDGVSVLDGAIEGIRVNESSSNVRVVNSTIRRTGFRGIEMYGSGGDDGYVVRDNTFSGTGSTAIYIYYTNGAVVDTNSVVDGYSRAIRIHLVNDARIVNNSIRENTYSFFTAIRVDVNSDNATIAGNSIVDNLGSSIVVGNWNVPSTGHTIADNYVHNASISGIVNYGNDTTISGNEVSEIDGTAVELFQVSNVTVRDGMTSRSEFGVHVNRSMDIELVNHSSTEHNKTGVWFEEADNSTIRNSSILDNNDAVNSSYGGVDVENATDVLVVDNVIRRNAIVGLSTYGADRIVVRNNRITENCGGNWGMAIYETPDALIVGNNVSNNTGDGIQIYDVSTNVTIADTRVNDNGGWGIQGAPGATFSNVTAIGNGGYGILPGQDSIVRNATVRDNGEEGFYISDYNVTLVDSFTVDNAGPELYVHSTAGDLSATNLQIGALRHDIVDAHDVIFNQSDGGGPAAPSDLEAVGPATNMSAGAGGYANVSVRYTGTQADGVDESTIGLYRYNDSNSTWDPVTGSTVDAGSNTVSANVTSFSTFRMLGEAASSGGPVFIPAPPSGDTTPSANFTVTDVTLDSTRVDVGELVTVSLRIENDGDAHGTFTGNLSVAGQVVDTGSVQVNKNYHATLELSTSFGRAGAYQLAVDEYAAGSVEVTGAASFSVSDGSVGTTSVEPGDTVTITATVSNDGSTESTAEVPLIVGGQEVDSRSVTLGSGESASVTFEHTFGDTGDQSVTVGGREVGTVAVGQSDGSDDGDSSGDDGLPIVPIVLGLGLLVLFGMSAAYHFYPERFDEMVERIRNYFE